MPYKDPEAARRYSREASRRYKARHPERHRASHLKWFESHGEEQRRKDRERHQADRDAGRVGYDPERYRQRIEAIAGRPRPTYCESCGSDNGGQPMEFDHDHGCCPGLPLSTCGACFRGWVCHSCNGQRR